jgi:hypothetical protein
MTIQPTTLQLVFNHVAFPPKLPGRSDSESEIEDVKGDLLNRLLGAVKRVKEGANDEALHVLRSIGKLLETCRLVNGSGFVNKASLMNSFAELQPGDAITVYIGEQNACLFIRKPQ